MNKTIYFVLLLATLLLLGTTSYYTLMHPPQQEGKEVVAATSTQATTTKAEAISPTAKILTTQTGKKIILDETNPNGESLSTIDVTTEGLNINLKTKLETNKLSDAFLLDMNKDSFDELVLVTVSQGSGSYGEAIIYTTVKDKGLTQVEVPKLREEDTLKGGIFEGYMGHDSFMVASGTLVREFPTYLPKDTNDLPTGPTRKLAYNLIEKDGVFRVEYINLTQGAATSTPVATSTKK